MLSFDTTDVFYEAKTNVRLSTQNKQTRSNVIHDKAKSASKFHSFLFLSIPIDAKYKKIIFLFFIIAAISSILFIVFLVN
jgi:hypothetical protein